MWQIHSFSLGRKRADRSVSVSRSPIISVVLLAACWLLASIRQRKQDSCWAEANDKNEGLSTFMLLPSTSCAAAKNN